MSRCESWHPVRSESSRGRPRGRCIRTSRPDVRPASIPIRRTTDPWANSSALITLSKKVPGLDTPAFESCVKNATYGGFADQNWADFNTLKLQGTPTVEINGTALTNAQLFSSTSKAGAIANTGSDGQGTNTTAVQAAVTKAYGNATPAPWASAPATSTASASATAS